MTDTIDLAVALIREESVSPADGRCQEIIAAHLNKSGFTTEAMPFGDVKNLWALRDSGDDGPLFVFAGHTDVVPTGNLTAWTHPPFSAVIADGNLHGRGAADMKGSLAAMLTATRRFVDDFPNHLGSIGFLITSDEEDVATDGTVKVMAALLDRGVTIDFCLIGEPSSAKQTGDVIRVGRRGSLNGELTVIGVQGHVAYPSEARNPIHEFAPVLDELVNTTWDTGNDFFPPTSFQISNINSGTGANNVIPAEMQLSFNFRFSTESSEESLRARTTSILARHGVEYRLDWKLSGPPFITHSGRLVPAVQAVIRETMQLETELSTAGGTSDGRFIAPLGIEVVELGPSNATIHKIDEQISIKELHQLADIYYEILKKLLGRAT